MHVRPLLLCLWAALVWGQAEALYGRKSPVQVLDSKNFDKMVVEQNMAAVVEFFAPWCGHCKNLAPTYEKVAQHLQGVATVGAVDCDADKNKPLCARYQVQGFPTLKVFPALPRQSTSSNKRPSKSPTDYNGPRNAKGIAEAATGQIPSKYIRKVKGKADLVDPTPPAEGTGLPAPLALLFTDKATSTPLYRSLSVRFVGKIAFAEARSKDNTELVEEFGITAFPTLVVIPPEGDHTKYTGDLKPAPLLEFLKGFAPASDDSSADAPADSASEEEKPKKTKKEPTIPDVVRNLTLADVAGLAESDDAFLIASFVGTQTETCAAEARAFNKLAFDLQDIIPVGQVNLSEDPSAARSLGLSSPSPDAKPCSFRLTLLPFGEKPEPEEWPQFSGEQTVKAVQAFAFDAYPAGLVPRLATMDSMQAFLHVEIGSPKIILFTTKPETPGIFRALAGNLRNTTFQFADVGSESVGILEQFGIKKVPAMALAFLDSPEDAPKLEGGDKLRLSVYPGPLKYPLMAAYVNAAAEALGFAESSSEEGSASMGSSKPRPVPQAVTNAQLLQACPPSSSMCVFGLLDASSQEHSAAVSALESAAGRHRSFGFVWVDTPSQPSFASGFGIGLADVPTAVAVSPKRERYQRVKGSLTLTSVNALVDGFATGKGYSVPFQELPQLVDGGEQGGNEVVEEDFDLADIMGQDLGAGDLTSKEARMQEIEAELQAEEQAQAEQAKAPSQKSSKKKKRKAKKLASKDEL